MAKTLPSHLRCMKNNPDRFKINPNQLMVALHTYCARLLDGPGFVAFRTAFLAAVADADADSRSLLAWLVGASLRRFMALSR